jgi:hypothetical protein
MIVGYWTLNNSETGKAGFDKIISHLGPCCVYCYFPEDITYAVLYSEVLSMKYKNLIKTVGSFFKIVDFFVHLKGFSFWS